MKPHIVWFRRNLRLADNAALIAAAEAGGPVIPVYVCDADDAGGASRWWLHRSLEALDRSIRSRGSALVIREGDPAQAIAELVAETDAAALYFARRYEPRQRRFEDEIQGRLSGRVDIFGFDDSWLNPPTQPLTRSGTPFKVFTPYWKAACARGEPTGPRPVPAALQLARELPASLSLSRLALLPSGPDWAQGLRDTWTPGEAAALDRLDALEDVVAGYADHRDRPDLQSTTRLSPSLHFGEISVRQVWHAVRGIERRLQASGGAESLLRQLFWRDFSTYLLFHFPELPDRPLRGEFDDFPWVHDGELLHAWQRGLTGYPIVDAGMRQLWSTGWMHNRVRMIAASFLVKDLLVPWQQGANWFLDTLVDADLANNSASWQWVAGCGTDAAPYFRIFNPVLQGRKFDPDGSYVRRWIPELDRDYPAPIVDHREARNRALAAYETVRGIRASKQAPR